MQRIYLDNAATTSLNDEVLETMMPYFVDMYGNPSSIHSYGRETRLAIESARKQVAGILNARPAEIFFTSGGTEACNTVINSVVRDLGYRHIISSPIEHHAVLHTIENLAASGEATISYVKLLPSGHIDLEDLEKLLSSSGQKSLVTLMHANNEIGNMLRMNAVGKLCHKYNALFHSDTVQTVGHHPFDLRNTLVHFITGSAHKFHGPKGVGLLYINENITIKPYLHGGGQERNMRSGTENLYGIVGFAKALEIATRNYETDSAYIQGIKDYAMQQFSHHISGIQFNGDPAGKSLYTILNISFPKTAKSEMLLYNLDINHICVSGGSACTSGTDIGSHVIRALDNNSGMVPIRFSFSKYNTKEEIDRVVKIIKEHI